MLRSYLAICRIALVVLPFIVLLLVSYWLIHLLLPQRFDAWSLSPLRATIIGWAIILVYAFLVKVSGPSTKLGRMLQGEDEAAGSQLLLQLRAKRLTIPESCCPLCEEAKSERSGCSFHPGTHVTGSARNAANPYREIYYWTCCGEKTLESSYPPREGPPHRHPGCAFRSSHLNTARVTLIYTPEYLSRLESLAAFLERRGILANALPLENYLSDARPADVVVLFVGGGDEGQAVKMSENSIDKAGDVPVVVYCDSALANAFQLQVTLTDTVSDNAVYEGIRQALRRRYFPRHGWQPDVFISYTRKSARLADLYAGYMHLSYWLDTDVLAPGVRWSTEIFTGIEKSRLFFLVVTPETPEPTYCWLELQEALSRKKKIFAVCHGDTEHKLFQATSTRPEDWREDTIKGPHDSPVRIRVSHINDVSLTLFDATPETVPDTELYDKARSLVAVLEEELRRGDRQTH